jgi:hypothetical protein
MRRIVMVKNIILVAVSWIVGAPLAIAMFLVLVVILGLMIDGIGQYDEQHDRCLKNATNGYEIKECRRIWSE